MTPNLTMGGAERWVVSMVKFAEPLQLQWTGVVVSGWGGIDELLCAELAQYTEVHTHEIPANGRPPDWRSLKHCRGVHKTFQRAMQHVCRDAQVVVTWGGVDIGAWADHLDIPVVLTSHTTEADGRTAPITGATHLAAVSEAAADYFRGRPGAERPLAVIYNGADRQRCVAAATTRPLRAAWGVEENDIVIGYVGRQSREKNPRAAIDAVAALPANYQAVYYGGPTLKDQTTARELRWLAERLAPGRVHFYSPVQDISSVLAGLDVFMLASEREAFSLGLIEAWLAGVPVVATPVGCLPELKRKYGQLVIDVPLHPSPSQLAKAVRQAHGPGGRRIAKNAQKIAATRFTCEAMVRRWTVYLEQVVNQVPYPQPTVSSLAPVGDHRSGVFLDP